MCFDNDSEIMNKNCRLSSNQKYDNVERLTLLYF